MDDRKMRIIQQLMEELQEEMKPGADEFDDRLGREKPKVDVMAMSSDGDMGDESGDMQLGDQDDMMPKDSPDELFKQRLMKLRG